jgi:hypothetical protein
MSATDTSTLPDYAPVPRSAIGPALFGVPATGNHAQWTAVDVYRMENGKIAEEWAADDLTAILHDMGLYTPPWLS